VAEPQPLRAWQTLLFVPASRSDLIGKAHRSAPDAIVLDLEDTVPADQKAPARAALAGAVATVTGTSPAPFTFVRVAAVDDPGFERDVVAAAASGAPGIVLSKAQRPEDLAELNRLLEREGATSVQRMAGIETGLGVSQVERLLEGPADGVYFGADDYIADIGGRRTRDSTEVLYARSRVALAARVAGRWSFDQIVFDVGDDAHFLADAAAGRSLGYTGKMCLHPKQIALTRTAWGASEAELAWAREVIGAHSEALAAGRAVTKVRGSLVDEPVVRRARQLLADAGPDA
jgi:citrate lyase subunit beta/citryl-CoA lyase